MSIDSNSSLFLLRYDISNKSFRNSVIEVSKILFKESVHRNRVTKFFLFLHHHSELCTGREKNHVFY